MTAYAELESIFRRVGFLQSSSEMLGWDTATMMPEGSADVRAEQSAVLKSIQHEFITSAQVAELLKKAASQQGLSTWQQSNLKLMQRQHNHATALNAGLVERLSMAASESEMEWRNARKNNDFKGFLPYFERTLDAVREAADAKSQKLGISAYDALIDQYDAGSNQAAIDRAFGPLEAFLPGFIAEVLAKQATRNAPVMPKGPFAVAAQKELGKTFMSQLGFDFERGRIDVSLHPFCGGIAGDVRITTRYDETDFTRALMGVLHETGHALYEQGLPPEHYPQPVGYALGMSIHESQSLLVEMQVCRSKAFLTYALPHIRTAFAAEGAEWEMENIKGLYTHVTPSLIRVDADEVTYPAHILLRYRLEKALIGGNMKPGDLPQAWKEGMKALLGVDVPNDKDGCLQDIHWPGGDFGYFPSYTLGAMHAAQFYRAARDQAPEIEGEIEKGNFALLLSWLRKNVHNQASLLEAPSLLKAATGKELDPDCYIGHLRDRYLN